MKTLIREVIQLDQQARLEIEELKREKEELFNSFKEMKADLKNHQLLELEKQTKQLEVDAQILFEQRLVQYQEKNAIREANIVKQYEANRDVWLKELMDFILGEDN